MDGRPILKATVIKQLDVFGDADGVGFKDVSGLVVCEFAAFNVVGIVGEVDLSFMVVPPLSFDSFSLRDLSSKGDIRFARAFFRSGSAVSEGIFHVFPVRKAPSIFPSAHQLRTVLSEILCLSANSLTERYPISARNFQ